MDRIGSARAAGTVGGTVLGFAVMATVGSFGQGLLLAPLSFGFAVLIAVAVCERLVKPPVGDGVRTASLQPRSVDAYLPRRSGAVVGGLLVLLAAVLVTTTATASEDATLGGMRVVACADRLVGAAHGPYAGSFYSVPLAVGLVVLLLLAALAARQAVLRPRGVLRPGVDDDVLRRRSLTVIVDAVGVGAGATLAGVALVSGAALRGLANGQDSCAAGWVLPLGWVFLLLGVVAGVAAVVFLVRVLAGDGRRR